MSDQSASVAALDFCKWTQVETDVFVPHRKYLVISHSSPCFSRASVAAFVHGNCIFCLYQWKGYETKFRQIIIVVKESLTY